MGWWWSRSRILYPKRFLSRGVGVGLKRFFSLTTFDLQISSLIWEKAEPWQKLSRLSDILVPWMKVIDCSLEKNLLLGGSGKPMCSKWYSFWELKNRATLLLSSVYSAVEWNIPRTLLGLCTSEQRLVAYPLYGALRSYLSFRSFSLVLYLWNQLFCSGCANCTPGKSTVSGLIVCNFRQVVWHEALLPWIEADITKASKALVLRKSDWLKAL